MTHFTSGSTGGLAGNFGVTTNNVATYSDANEISLNAVYSF